MFTLNLKISGITCDACIRLITLKVKRIEGVSDICITDKNGDATIASTKPITIDMVKESLKHTTYKIDTTN